jgi:hypothetical protein
MLLAEIKKKFVRFGVLTALTESEGSFFLSFQRCLLPLITVDEWGYICHDNGGRRYVYKDGKLVPDYAM